MTSPIPGGSDGLTCSIFSLTCMRTMSRSWPQLNSMVTSALSAEDSERSFFTPESVESTSSPGLVISFSTCVGLELG